MLNSVMFVLCFSVVFGVLGASAIWLGEVLVPYPFILRPVPLQKGGVTFCNGARDMRAGAVFVLDTQLLAKY